LRLEPSFLFRLGGVSLRPAEREVK
jgi:hypothetical protein